jgi:hydrogenase maturation protein HypF
LSDNSKTVALLIHIRGLVQGVGFRPFVYRLASQHDLHGWIVNRTDGVQIKVEGPKDRIPGFVENLRMNAPVVSQIDEISVQQDLPEGLDDFRILESQDMSGETSEISPDITVCSDCIKDMRLQLHRIDYPFVNCTNCGPRFSIIRDFPYDRATTTMEPFTMCDTCSQEYSDILDRRFHAQPVACKRCGPHYSLHAGNSVLEDFEQIMQKAADMISEGEIITLKGTGGFHLMCDAFNEKAVLRLRKLKKREGKPFAVMFRDLENLRQFAEVSPSEERTLTSWKRPIVILKSLIPLVSGITLNLNTLGVFLPYMPFHYLLFEKLRIPAIVLTSGNIADEPIIIDNETAIRIFEPLTHATITYNRDIYNRNDDSVVSIMAGQERIFRRSRSYVPAPVRIGNDVDGILAAGAELSNCFCIGKSDRAYLSQHIGDLKNHETYAFYEETISRFQKLFRVKLHTVAADMHPDYLSTRFARESGMNTVYVQHHHAHIASCMAENGVNEPLIGLAFDGTGYGTDGHIWGSEFMVCDYVDYKRYAHFSYMPVPGGDLISKEPWRMGISLLYQSFGNDFLDLNLPILKAVDMKKIKMVTEAIDKKINCPLSSGSGRLFDAVAAITGICTHALFHAEAPMRLESSVNPNIRDCYAYDMDKTISFIPAIRQICNDLSTGIKPDVISARFHNTVVEASLNMVVKIKEVTGIQKAALSGGTFQNKYLFESLYRKLLEKKFMVVTHHKVPCNDGGIALGQLVVAAKKKI